MEKRALLAFVLSLLILVVWQLYFTPQTKPPQKVESPSSTEQAAPSKPSPSAPLQSISPQSLPKDRMAQLDQQFEKWTGDSALYTMQILAPGARIKSIQLKKYRQSIKPDSPPMEMLPTQSTGYLPLAVGTDGGRSVRGGYGL
ncbi:MAG: membrane protein insertase YidC, partial [Syntrophobacteraceae bacterium]|nr:membrane protein insertase YidC [Syntrophobacteraceae bacterium]